MEISLDSPFDAHMLASKDEYSVYFNLLLHHLGNLNPLRKTLGISEQETALVTQYMQHLTHTLQAMRLRYMYDPEHNIKLDVHESGFPTYNEIRTMYNELRVKNELGNKLIGIEQLKKNALDYLLTERQPLSDTMLYNLSLQYYLQTVQKENLFCRCIKSKLLPSQSPDASSNSYLISWASYDSGLNRPLLFFMYFDYSGKKVEDEVANIYKSIESNGTYLRELVLTASMIDKDLVDVHPKLIKCIDIGPFHSVFSQDENPLSVALRKGVTDRTLEAQTGCLEVRIDILRSVGETRSKAGGLIWNKDHQVFQQYFVPTTNSRGASETKCYTLGSHALMQYLSYQNITTENYITTPEITVVDTQKQL